MRSRPSRAACAAALVLLVASGCEVGIGFQANNEKPQLNATPPPTPLADPVDDPRLEPSLLEAGTLQDMVGAPLYIEEMSAEEAGLTENPDPRGPCGQIAGAAEPPPWDDAALSVFVWEDAPPGSLTHAVWDLPGDSAARLYSKFRRQYEPGCPPYESETPWGTQTVTVGPPVEIEAPARTDAFGFTMDVELEGGGGAGAVAVMRRGPRLGSVMVLSAAPLSSQFLAEAMTEAARRL